MQSVTMKFGGTSVGSVEAIQNVVEIVKKARADGIDKVAVVVSAMSGVTNMLEEGITSAAEGDPHHHHVVAQNMYHKHHEAARTLLEDEFDSVLVGIKGLIEEYTRFCDSVRVLGETTPRALDYTMGLGERMSILLVAAALRTAGQPSEAIEATRLIVTDARFQNAAPIFDETEKQIQAVLNPLLEAGKVPVITGFIGATKDGVSTTLGRGGSDFSAAIFAACLKSDELWIWTDVDGVMSADPRIVSGARSIETLTSREVSELAYYGAKVLHPKTIRPVMDRNIPLRVKNTFNPDHPGTLIVENDTDKGAKMVKAVTAIRDVSMLTVEGTGILGVPGSAARTFGAVARTGTSVLLISQASSEQSICFMVPQGNAKTVAQALEAEFEREMARGDLDRVCITDDATIITVVGTKMMMTPGVAARIFSATGEAKINVIAIAQGSSDCSISLVVSEKDGDEAVRAIHALTLDD